MLSPYVGVVTTLGAALIAGAVGGVPLNVTHIALGDGAGSVITPAAANTQLVNEVWRGPIVAGGRDTADPSVWRFSAEVDEAAGPFDVREIGLFAADGTMIAIARHPLVIKPVAVDGALVAILTDIIVPIATAAAVNVAFIGSDNAIGIWRLLRAPFVAVNSATVTAPPGAPAIGDIYVVPAGATGAWSGLTHKLVQWNSGVWTAFDAPLNTIVGVIGGDWLKRTAGGWETFSASETAFGLVKLASAAEAAAGVDAGKAITPARLATLMALKAPVADPTFTTKATAPYISVTGPGAGNALGLAGTNNPAIYVNSVKRMDFTTTGANLTGNLVVTGSASFTGMVVNGGLESGSVSVTALAPNTSSPSVLYQGNQNGCVWLVSVASDPSGQVQATFWIGIAPANGNGYLISSHQSPGALFEVDLVFPGGANVAVRHNASGPRNLHVFYQKFFDSIG